MGSRVSCLAQKVKGMGFEGKTSGYKICGIGVRV